MTRNLAPEAINSSKIKTAEAGSHAAPAPALAGQIDLSLFYHLHHNGSPESGTIAGQ
jgi:hypothetical protein